MIEEEKSKVLSFVHENDKRILDVGCGDGRYSEIFFDRCDKYIGIDIDDKQIDINIKKNKYDYAFFECADIVDYQSEDKFDLIILSLSFHEIDIKKQGLALMNMLNLLNKGGRILILDPALERDSFQGLWNVAYDNLLFFNHDYTVRHSKEVIDQACKNKLCKVVNCDIISLKFEFSDMKEIVDMILESFEFGLIKQEEGTKERLEIKLKEFLARENDIVIYDKLDITVLEKLEC